MNSKGASTSGSTAAVSVLGKRKYEASTSGPASVFDVFLSFCGIDTRNGFTDYLYEDLVGAGIKTFRDNEALRLGEEIGPDLLKAITESKISIPIFSKNYASSKWFLRELEQIVECHKNGEQKIYPIFYDVVPSDVRNQRGFYEVAFSLHEKNFDKGIIQRWRDALEVVGRLKGLELEKETNGHEGKLVKLVVEKVLKELKKNYTDQVPQTDLVGMDNHIKELMGHLEVDSNDVRIIGIHGMGGLGKTTMTKVIYNQMCNDFDGQWFFDNVREKSKDKDGVAEMQKRISSVSDGRNSGKKLLLVLDDIDDYIQVDRLMGELTRFGARSRIILTTRNKEVLDKIEVNCEDPFFVYKCYIPKFMEFSDSLQLFSKHAFKRDFPIEEYTILSEKVVSIAAGLPLVLVVLGSTFLGLKDKRVWEEKLMKLRRIPHKDVLKQLMFSFEALDLTEKEIFLDIACLFIDRDKTRPTYMWESCELYPYSGINVLVSRSLITIDDEDKFQMHDQLRDLGRHIDREEGLQGKQSRLWHSEEALEVLQLNQGTNCVKALSLEYPYDADAAAPHFPHLPNLRYLSMEFVKNVDGDFKDLLPNLRWLQCSLMPGKFSLRNLNMKNLVILNLSEILELTDDWDGWRQLKMANNLKVLYLSFCPRIKKLNLPNLTKLVELHLINCRELVEIQGLEKLEFLQVLKIACPSLRRLPNISSLKDLEVFYARYCGGLRQIEGLRLISLEYLDLYKCDSLEVEGLEDLSNLNKLKVIKCAHGCLNLTTDFSNFKNLKKLEIYGSKRIEIQNLDGLEALEELEISKCSSIVRLPNLSYLNRLKKLFIFECEQLIEIPDLSELKSLEELKINGCRLIKALPNLSYLNRLKRLVINKCEQLIEIPDLSPLQKLKDLELFYCANLSEIRGIEELKCLENLNIEGSWGLCHLAGLDLPNVRIYGDIEPEECTVARSHKFKHLRSAFDCSRPAC